MKPIPLLHITDLYHPPQDPDDHLDLATIAALGGSLDLKAVVLDPTRPFLLPEPQGSDIARDPGFVPVAQLGYLLGRPIPVASGPADPLARPTDDCHDRPAREQAGVRLILETLEASESPVLISCVGSARALTAAFNRAPDLLRARTRAVLLNAGSTGGPKREWNVGLDVAAYTGLWRSRLPIHWYPCGTDKSAFEPDDPRGTYWRASHRDLFRDIPQSLMAWFAYAYTGSARGDIIRSLDDLGKDPVWEIAMSGSRHIWSTASLVMAAGLELAKTPEGWRFTSPEAARQTEESWPWRLDPISAKVDPEGRVTWSPAPGATQAFLFGRKAGKEFSAAMAEALNALFRQIPL